MTNRWTFTVFNYGDWRPVFNPAQMEYLIWQEEVAPETGNRHIQGYVRWKARKRIDTCRNALCCASLAPHLEAALGTEEDNKKYCSKAETRLEGTEFHEFGTYDGDQGRQGQRTDLETISAKIMQGTSMSAVAAEHPSDFIRYHQGFYALQQAATPKPPLQREMTVYVLWGPTGQGKTHRVRMAYPEIYEAIAGRDPWGAYNGEEEILFDEWDYTKWTIQEMNRYLDKWRCTLDARYRNRYAAWTLVVICANSRPESWWPEQANSYLMNAFLRRISATIFIPDRELEVPLRRLSSGGQTTQAPAGDAPRDPSDGSGSSSSGLPF